MTQHDREETPANRPGVDASLARHGGLSYLEIPAVDPRRSAAFYEQVLGWRVQERVGRVTAHGGEVVKPPYPEGNLWVATVRDPAGNLLGLWQEGPR